MNESTREALEAYAESLRNKIQSETQNLLTFKNQVFHHSTIISDVKAKLRQVEEDLDG